MCVWLSQSLRGGGRPCTPMVQALLSPRAPQLLCPLLELAGSSLGGCAGVPRAPCCLWCRGAIKVQSWRHAGHPPPPRVPHLIGDRPPRGATEVPTRAGARGSERALPHRSGLGGCPHMRLHVHFSGVSGGCGREHGDWRASSPWRRGRVSLGPTALQPHLALLTGRCCVLPYEGLGRCSREVSMPGFQGLESEALWAWGLGAGGWGPGHHRRQESPSWSGAGRCALWSRVAGPVWLGKPRL